MSTELPETAPQLVYSKELAIELLGGRPSSVRAIVQAGHAKAIAYGMSLALARLNSEPPSLPPADGLFDYQTRAYVDLLLAGGGREADLAAEALMKPRKKAPPDMPMFHRDELTLWARHVGLLEWPTEARPAAVAARAAGGPAKRMKAADRNADAIRGALAAAGLDPMALPAYRNGDANPSKAVARKALQDLTESAFERGWEALPKAYKPQG